MKRNAPDIQSILDRAAAVEPVQKPHLEGIQDLPPEHPIFQIADEHRGPTYVPRGPSFRYFSAEERELVREILHRNPDAGQVERADGTLEPIFVPRFPFELNGQPPEAEKRRVYCTLFGECDVEGCGGRVAWWIDRYYLKAGRYCEACHKDIPTAVDSWASRQWTRRPAGAVESDFEGFIADDPALQEMLPLWRPNQVFHLGSGMSTGKTTLLFKQAARLRVEDSARKFIYLGARVSQVRGIWEEFSEGREASKKMQYGLFCQGVEKPYKRIGTHGAIATISSLRQVLERFGDDAGADIFLAIDEVDFGIGLMNASIMKDLKRDNKALLQRCLGANGIVVAGQTENTLALEAFAIELGIRKEDVTGYYKRGTLSATATIYEYPHVKGMRGLAIASVMERCRELMSDGKRPYVFCQGRRTAGIIASLDENALIFDAYTRGEKRIKRMLREQKTNAPLVVFSCAVDVGISLKDSDGQSIILMDENPRYLNSVASTAQQGVRDRNDADREFHILSFENSLPAAPSFYARVGKREMQTKLHADESPMDTVVSHLAARWGLDELSDSQPIDYLRYHLEFAGFEVEVADASRPADKTLAQVARLRKASVQKERELTAVRAKHLLFGRQSRWETADDVTVRIARETDAEGTLTAYNEVLSADDIRFLGTQGLLRPAPLEQLSHELALHVSLAVGYAVPTRYERDQAEQALDNADGDIGGDVSLSEEAQLPIMEDAQLGAAQAFIDAGIKFNAFQRHSRGFMAVHHNEVVHAMFKRERGETTHREDYRGMGGLLTSLLRHIPAGVLEFDVLADAVESALQERYGDDRFFDMLKSGALGRAQAKAFRFISLASPLGSEDTAEDSRERLVEWVQSFLPKFYPCRVSRTRDRFQLLRDAHWDTKLACIQSQRRYQHGLEGGACEPAYEDLMPSTAQRADVFADEKQEARRLYEQGEALVDIAESVGMSLGTVKRAVQGLRQGHKTGSLTARVLECLGDGELWKTQALAETLDADRSLLGRALTKLQQHDEILKVKRGQYRLG